MPPTFPPFLHHVVEQAVGVMLNLTPLTERNVLKSHAYWPEATNTPMRAGEWSVHLVGEQPSAACASLVERRLRLERGESKHELTLLHYTGWKDHGALPQEELEALLRAVTGACDATAPHAPLWVHCSAGIGRSGTVIGAFLAQQMPPPDLSPIDWAASITLHMRAERPGMVQTPGQLLTLASVLEKM